MTNKKFHRRARALDRLDAAKMTPMQEAERNKLRRLVGEYRAGLHRAKNGRWATLHHSGAAA